MKQIYIRIYAVMVSVVILGGIFWFVFSISKSNTERAHLAEKQFDFLVKTIGSKLEASSTLGESEKNFIQSLCMKIEHLEALALSDAQQELFVWPASSQLFSYDQNKNIYVQENILFMKVFTASLTLHNFLEPIFITGAITTVPTDILFSHSRTMFFIILTLFLITTILLITHYVYEMPDKLINKEFSANNTSFDYNDNSIQTESFEEAIDESTYDEPAYLAHTEEDETPSPIDTKLSLSSLDNLNLYKPYPESPFYDKSETNSLDSSSLDSSIDEEDEGEKFIIDNFSSNSYSENYTHDPDDELTDALGLIESDSIDSKKENPFDDESIFNLRTTHFDSGSFGSDSIDENYQTTEAVLSEQYLDDELNAQLQQLSEQEDLALFLFSIKDIDHTMNVSNKIIEMFNNRFTLNKNLFEFQSNGYACILKKDNLEEAVYTAEQIYDAIQSILIEKMYGKDIRVGITIAAKRSLSASQMIQEAEGALAKANENSNDPIIAFRASL